MTHRNRSAILLLVVSLAGCGVVVSGDRDSGRDASAQDVAIDRVEVARDVVAEDVVHEDSGPDADAADHADAVVFADGAVCRVDPGFERRDCLSYYASRGEILTPYESVACCAGQCFRARSCFVEDPTRARCDLAEAPCADDQWCCRLSTLRYDCRPAGSPTCRP